MENLAGDGALEGFDVAGVSFDRRIEPTWIIFPEIIRSRGPIK